MLISLFNIFSYFKRIFWAVVYNHPFRQTKKMLFSTSGWGLPEYKYYWVWYVLCNLKSKEIPKQTFAVGIFQNNALYLDRTL